MISDKIDWTGRTSLGKNETHATGTAVPKKFVPVPDCGAPKRKLETTATTTTLWGHDVRRLMLESRMTGLRAKLNCWPQVSVPDMFDVIAALSAVDHIVMDLHMQTIQMLRLVNEALVSIRNRYGQVLGDRLVSSVQQDHEHPVHIYRTVDDLFAFACDVKRMDEPARSTLFTTMRTVMEAELKSSSSVDSHYTILSQRLTDRISDELLERAAQVATERTILLLSARMTKNIDALGGPDEAVRTLSTPLGRTMIASNDQ